MSSLEGSKGNAKQHSVDQARRDAPRGESSVEDGAGAHYDEEKDAIIVESGPPAGDPTRG